MNDELRKKLRDFIEGALAAAVAGAITVVVTSGANVNAKTLVFLALAGALSAAIAYARFQLANNLLPVIKDYLSKPSG